MFLHEYVIILIRNISKTIDQFYPLRYLLHNTENHDLMTDTGSIKI